MLRVRRLSLSLVLTAICMAGFSASAQAYFSPTSFWNTPLGKNAAIDSRSPAWVTHMQEKVDTYLPWINTTQYGVPLYTVPASQPRTWVWIEKYNDSYQGDFLSVPIPENAQASNDTDHHLAIWQPSTDTYWEFWNFYKAPDGWHAQAGARILKASTSNGIVPNLTGAPFPSPYGATATGLPLIGGMITPSELQNRRINHVVQIAIPNPLHEWWYTWPAQRSDGTSLDACDVPEGARFRLPANLNISALGLSPVADTIARAVQKYGMVVQDKGGAVTFATQDPVNMASNPYPALFQNKSPNEVLARFPWSKLEALKSQPNQAWPAPNILPC